MREEGLPPWAYECPATGRGGMHIWVLLEGGHAQCERCNLILSHEDTAECLNKRSYTND